MMDIKRLILIFTVIFLSACSNGKYFIIEDSRQTAENMIEKIDAFQDFEYEVIPAEDEINTRNTDVLFIDNGTFIIMTGTGAVQEIYFYDMANDDIRDIFGFMGLEIPQEMKQMMKDPEVNKDGYQGQVGNVEFFYDDGASSADPDQEADEQLKSLKMTFSEEE